MDRDGGGSEGWVWWGGGWRWKWGGMWIWMAVEVGEVVGMRCGGGGDGVVVVWWLYNSMGNISSGCTP